MGLYSLHGAPAPDWGDYSEILIAGMADRLGRHDGMLQLERTGPFVPPITFPGVGIVVVTEALKQRLEVSRLTGFSFLPVIKKRIVLLEWEKWDEAAEEPQVYPNSGEPEDYILERSHSEYVARELGELWEVCLEVHAELVPYQGLAHWDGSDWFRVRGNSEVYNSENAKQWLQAEVPQWVTFQKAQVV